MQALVFFSLHFSRSVWGAMDASSLLLSAAALVVCIQVRREGARRGGLSPSSLVFFHSHFSRYVGGRGYERLSTLGGASYGMHTSGTGGRARSGICFVCFHPCIFPLIFLPRCVGDRGCKRRSTLGDSAYDTYTSGMGELAREDVFGGAVYFSIYVIGSLIG